MKFELSESELERNLDWLKSKNTGLSDYGIVIRHLLNEIEELKKRRETKNKTDKTMIPNKEQNPEGLHGKYKIQKADGTPVKPEAEYFVLRLDAFGDFLHVEAGRKAMKVYADEIEEHIPQLAKDLRERYDLDRA